MATYPDLSQYECAGSDVEMVNVGWLGRESSYPTGKIDAGMRSELLRRADAPASLMRGTHDCELREEESPIEIEAVVDFIDTLSSANPDTAEGLPPVTPRSDESLGRPASHLPCPRALPMSMVAVCGGWDTRLCTGFRTPTTKPTKTLVTGSAPYRRQPACLTRTDSAGHPASAVSTTVLRPRWLAQISGSRWHRYRAFRS
jgi:hypothetical protein